MKSQQMQMNLPKFMANQPTTPPTYPPPRNKVLLEEVLIKHWFPLIIPIKTLI